MKTIHKFPLNEFSTEIDLPYLSEVLDAQFQEAGPAGGQTLQLWVLLDTEVPTERRTFIVTGTGHELEPNAIYTHVSTVQAGPMVWHVLEVEPVKTGEVHS